MTGGGFMKEIIFISLTAGAVLLSGCAKLTLEGSGTPERSARLKRHGKRIMDSTGALLRSKKRRMDRDFIT